MSDPIGPVVRIVIHDKVAEEVPCNAAEYDHSNEGWTLNACAEWFNLEEIEIDTLNGL